MSRIAIAFGTGADTVAPSALGERLARAIGQEVVSGPPRTGDSPASGGVLPRGGLPGRDGPTPRSSGLRVVPTSTVVTVERHVDGRPAAHDVVVRLRDGTSGRRMRNPRFRHRTIIRHSTERLAGYGTRYDDHLAARTSVPRALLVIDLDLSTSGSPGLAARTTATLAERMGYRSRVASCTAGDTGSATDVEGAPPDVVVLMVPSEPAGNGSSWASSTWSVAARLCGRYRALGAEIVAVSTGAGAGPLAGCLEQGAQVLFDLNALPAELERLSAPGPLGGHHALNRHSARLPYSIQALLKLTASERRVLYFLTTGHSAQEIADDLAVSLATVRSHIRSVLRKLEVRSQLAAVALANGRGPVPAELAHSI